ncbi:RNA-binding protein 7-like [Acanthaster planci]|uniref:RNA-binding protein 7-like n=1 Tax=Acanthaster planci TaxID=133434 RepID=A0A8B7Z7G0_ACAPL|nr:RNA-binding protein 7-like [Acanthaster planci]
MGDGSSRDDRTVYVKNLDIRVTEEILFELFLQAGPLIGVKRPKEPDGTVKSFAFVEFEHDVSPPYARSLMDGIRLFGRSIGVQFRNGSKHSENSRGNSPAGTPPYMNSSGHQSPALNGLPSFPLPPMIQRSVSAPQGFPGLGSGLPAMGMPPPLMGNFPVHGFFPAGVEPRPVHMPLMQLQQQQLDGPSDRQPPQHHFQDRQDGVRHHQNHRHHPSSSPNPHHRSSHQSPTEEQRSRSHRREGHHHGHSSGSDQDNRYHSNRGQHSEERRHGSEQRHRSHQHHRQERRDHPYRR